ncbi:DUF6844 domain-containing protein [Oceanisphaera pacifica]|uniref:DUF6844 domain-containing protein n=1 Tax=Oceanisphaera pacifica TaxID=2818389 RepID=A0ABS3NC78_9GAMM|nr:hypothetical protein [Oceanisphaera pacifica]MBO1518155.1 hypothetical protein [Oceanisphaera pacifica]
MKTFLYGAMFLGLYAGNAVAQTPATAPAPAQIEVAEVAADAPDAVDDAVAAPAQTEIEIVKAVDAGIKNAHRHVSEQAERYVSKRRQAYRQQGRANEVFLQYGVADISLQSSAPDWGDARTIAYLQAQTKARESLISELHLDVSSKVARESFRTNKGPEFSPEELRSESKMNAMMNKLVAVVDGSLNSKLVELGVDPNDFEAAPKSKRKVMMRKAMMRETETRARGEISGAMIVKTFEVTDDNGNTSVAVVLSTSNKMKNLLASLQSSKGQVVPKPEKPGVNLDNFLEANKPNLMYEYGVKMLRDEQGYPMLVSFGMAGNDCNPVDYEECNDNRDFAFIEAQQEAYAHISEAYNLYGSMKTNTSKGSQREKVATLTKTEGGEDTVAATTTKLLKETRQMSQMSSSVEGLVGLSVAKRWTHTHPTSGREVNGVVVAWHPQKEQAMRTFKAGKSPAKPASQQPQNSGSNQGASMDLMDISDF